uniref:Nudix hydrolase domain-containing protein n=1 Tax=Haptolina brevifila TaxID=156173 RepID=A0A7S2N0P1_9EUKA
MAAAYFGHTAVVRVLAHARADVAPKPFDKPDSKPLGTKWVSFKTKPSQGRDLTNKYPQLAKALEEESAAGLYSKRFSAAEWQALGISEVMATDYIRSGDVYFEPASMHDDALMLATRNGHLNMVRFLMSVGSENKKREAEAEKIALRIATEAFEAGENARMEHFTAVAEFFNRKRLVRHRSGRVLKQNAQQNAEPFTGNMIKVQILSELARTTWDKKAMFDGMIVPPRPTAAEIEEKATAHGTLIEDSGVVVQRGPFESIWLRAGVMPNTPWHTLWRKLTQYVQVALEEEKKKTRCGAIYVVISLRSMQAIDFAWLADHGFRFHHFRAANRDMAPESANGCAPLANPRRENHGGRNSFKHNEEAYLSEFVYYCWPHGGAGSPDDMVPPFATSIEGVTGIVFSPDTSKILMVWERKAWSTPGGAVNEGESLFSALRREVYEEVRVDLDPEWEHINYLGGWQDQRARDNFVNDNFAALSMRAVTDEFKADDKEITHAIWVPWQPLLNEWIRMGRPLEKRVKIDNFQELVGLDSLPEGRNTVLVNVLNWIETWKEGRGFKVRHSSKEQGPVGQPSTVNKLIINAFH